MTNSGDQVKGDVDWTNDEAVVKAALPNVMFMPQGHPYQGINYHNGKTMQWIGEDWKEARTYIKVVAFEARAKGEPICEDHGNPETWSDENFADRGGILQPKITDHYFDECCDDKSTCSFSCGRPESEHVSRPASQPSAVQGEPQFVQKKALTVLMRRPVGDKLADADLLALSNGTVLRTIDSDLYLTQLRLRAQEDQTLYDKIEVIYQDENGIQHPIGLRFEDELKWPPRFAQEAWDIETKISALRDPVASLNPEAPQQGHSEWVNCPVCGESDMEMFFYAGDPEAPIISCSNHACASNGGTNHSAIKPEAPEGAKELENLLGALDRLKVHVWDQGMKNPETEFERAVARVYKCVEAVREAGK